MADVMDILGQVLGGDTVRQISGQIGQDEQATGTAVSAALPMLLAALAKNASTAPGAAALHQALGDHDGAVLEQPAAIPAGAADGQNILGHVLGNRQGATQQAVAGVSGIDPAAAGQVLAMLAPLVMGAIGRVQRQQGLDANGVSALLQGEHRDAAQAAPDFMRMATGLLDGNHDGSIVDDLGGMVGKLFGR